MLINDYDINIFVENFFYFRIKKLTLFENCIVNRISLSTLLNN